MSSNSVAAGQEGVGTLYIVATPIGNLDDISQRALDILQMVDLIAAEDTRHSQKLLSHFQIQTKLTSLHDHNEKQRADYMVSLLKQGQNIALISDAGTPLISDPGYSLVNLCRQHQLRVTPIPGASAVITALCSAGLPTDKFAFEGFLPVKEQARRQQLQLLRQSEYTSVFYESPRRIKDTIKMISEEITDSRTVVIAKELTKAFETFVSGNANEIWDWLDEDDVHCKGEFVLMIGPQPKAEKQLPIEALDLLALLTKELPLKKAAAITAAHYSLKKNELYQIGLEQKL